MGGSESVTSCQFPSMRRQWEGAELCTQWKLHRTAVAASRAKQSLLLFIWIQSSLSRQDWLSFSKGTEKDWSHHSPCDISFQVSFRNGCYTSLIIINSLFKKEENEDTEDKGQLALTKINAVNAMWILYLFIIRQDCLILKNSLIP